MLAYPNNQSIDTRTLFVTDIHYSKRHVVAKTNARSKQKNELSRDVHIHNTTPSAMLNSRLHQIPPLCFSPCFPFLGTVLDQKLDRDQGSETSKLSAGSATTSFAQFRRRRIFLHGSSCSSAMSCCVGFFLVLLLLLFLNYLSLLRFLLLNILLLQSKEILLHHLYHSTHKPQPPSILNTLTLLPNTTALFLTHD
jgi:hypothetical protein